MAETSKHTPSNERTSVPCSRVSDTRADASSVIRRVVHTVQGSTPSNVCVPRTGGQHTPNRSVHLDTYGRTRWGATSRHPRGMWHRDRHTQTPSHHTASDTTASQSRNANKLRKRDMATRRQSRVVIRKAAPQPTAGRCATQRATARPPPPALSASTSSPQSPTQLHPQRPLSGRRRRDPAPRLPARRDARRMRTQKGMRRLRADPRLASLPAARRAQRARLRAAGTRRTTRASHRRAP